MSKKDYTFVDYIAKGDGEATIIINQKDTNLTSVECCYYIPDAGPSAGRFSPYNGSLITESFDYGNGVPGVFVRYRANSSEKIPVPTGKHKIKFDKGVFRIDNKVIYDIGIDDNPVTGEISTNIYGNYALPSINLPNTRLYGVKIWVYTDETRATKNLIYDLVPAIRKEDGVIGLYNNVNDTFFAPTQGKFVAGTEQTEKNDKIASLNFKYDYSPVILWQYSNAERLKNIIDNEQKFLDTAITQFRDEFDSCIFNIDTCDANGLELWGKLLQISRPIIDGDYFTDEQYALLLKSRLFAIRWDGSGFSLSTLIKNLFPNAIFSITDCPLDEHDNPEYMTVNIDFAGGLTSAQEAVLRMGYLDEDTGEFVYTFLPRPAGVQYNISFTGDWAKTLGFAETVTEDSYTGMTETTNMDDTQTPNEDAGVFYK